MNLTVRLLCPEGKIPDICMDLRIGMNVNRKKETTCNVYAVQQDTQTVAMSDFIQHLR